jgi:hypothetical protein
MTPEQTFGSARELRRGHPFLDVSCNLESTARGHDVGAYDAYTRLSAVLCSCPLAS